MSLKLTSKKHMPPIFICGCGRSGTTLLLRILGLHRDVYAFHGETHFFRGYKDLPLINDFNNLTLSVLSVMLHGNEIAIKMIAKREFPADVTRVFEEIRKQSGFKELQDRYQVFDFCANFLSASENKTRWVDKSGGYIYNVQHILNLYPKCKFVEIYRDPRAVYLSWTRSNFEFFKQSSPIACLSEWSRSTAIGERLLEEMPQQYYRIRYEYLINNPEKELRELCKFLDLDFDPKMLEVKGYESSFKDTRNKAGFHTKSIDRWKQSLTVGELLFVDLATKKQRKKLSYLDSDLKLTIKNLFPFVAFLLSICVRYRSHLKVYLRSKLVRLFKGFTYATRCTEL